MNISDNHPSYAYGQIFETSYAAYDWPSPASYPGAASPSTGVTSELPISDVCTSHGRTDDGKPNTESSRVSGDAGVSVNPPTKDLVKRISKMLKSVSKTHKGETLSFGYPEDHPKAQRFFYNIAARATECRGHGRPTEVVKITFALAEVTKKVGALVRETEVPTLKDLLSTLETFREEKYYKSWIFKPDDRAISSYAARLEGNHGLAIRRSHHKEQTRKVLLRLLAFVQELITQVEVTKKKAVRKEDLELVVRDMVKIGKVIQTRLEQVLPWN